MRVRWRKTAQYMLGFGSAVPIQLDPAGLVSCQAGYPDGQILVSRGLLGFVRGSERSDNMCQWVDLGRQLGKLQTRHCVPYVTVYTSTAACHRHCDS